MIGLKERNTDERSNPAVGNSGVDIEYHPATDLDRHRQTLMQAAVLLRMDSVLQTVQDKLATLSAGDYTPPQCAKRCQDVGIAKGNLNTLSTILLGIMAGAFIGLGAMLCTIVTTDTGLGFGLNKLLGGLVFCLGLILVVVAGAELFTGNCLIVVSWISGKTGLGRLARNWGLVYFANLAGSVMLVGLVFATMHWSLNGYGVGANALQIANAKVNLSFASAFSRGILCNFLVCLAVWLCFSAKSVPGKILAILFPITAFVAAGFEHSVANMYFIPMGMLMAHQGPVLEAAGVSAAGVSNLDMAGFVGNLVPVTLGNIIGGAVMVGVVYWVSYLRRERAAPAVLDGVWKETGVSKAQPKNAQASPLLVGVGSKGLFEVLGRARDDPGFLARFS